LSPVTVTLLVRQQTLERRDAGLVYDNRPAQPPFPLSVFARQDMSLARFLAQKFPCTGFMKPFTGSAVRFHFHGVLPFQLTV
jgi:hypothetical protein